MRNPAIVFTGKDEIEVQDLPLPEIKPGQILVEASTSLISTGTEMICFGRKFEPGSHWDNWVKYPFYPGYSLAGRVAAVGEGVTAFKEGDRVAVRKNHRKFVVENATAAQRIPDGVSDEDATWLGIAKITQVGVRHAHHELGDAVVIIGLGILGQLVTQYVRLMGARTIIAIDTAAPRLHMAADHGATHTMDIPASEAREAVIEVTNGRLADVVYDVTGHPNVFPHALPLARKFGKVILLGDAGIPSEQRLTGDVITRGLQIIGAHDVHAPTTVSDRDYWTQPHMIDLFFAYLQRGQMRVNDLITHRYSPQDAATAYHMLATDRMNAMGVLFDWSNH